MLVLVASGMFVTGASTVIKSQKGFVLGIVMIIVGAIGFALAI
jgi:hypothetical protein